MSGLDLSPVERAGLRVYLQRVVALDDRAAVRVQARGHVAGVWAGPPFGVLTLRPVALLMPGDADSTVSAQRLIETIDSSEGTGETELSLPASVVGPAWAALLPPSSGWEPEAEVPASTVVDQVLVAVEGFRRRVDQLPADGRTPTALEDIAEQLWEAPSVGSVPLRAAHAARQVGLLSREGMVSSFRCGPWSRLGCPGGSVLVRPELRGSMGSGGLGTLDVLGAFS